MKYAICYVSSVCLLLIISFSQSFLDSSHLIQPCCMIKYYPQVVTAKEDKKIEVVQWMMENTLKATYFQEYERKEGEQKIKDEQFGSHLVDR